MATPITSSLPHHTAATQSTYKHNEVDVLSGMSGGPIMCSNDHGYDLAGIVKEGFDIQSKENQLVEGNNIRIFGKKIGLKEFNIWTKSMPHIERLEGKTKELYIPLNMRE